MKEYDSKDRLITKEDWENWLKLKEEHSDKPLLNLPEASDEDGSKYAVIEWHRYPEEKPKEDDKYIVTVCTKHALFTTTCNWISRKNAFEDYWDELVTAWAEKPKPYKEEKNNG